MAHNGSQGHWQKYGDHRLGERKWIYLCNACSHGFWRDYTKIEEFYDWHTCKKEYPTWLNEELIKLQEMKKKEEMTKK